MAFIEQNEIYDYRFDLESYYQRAFELLLSAPKL